MAAMNTELPPFKNGEHNSESASTVDRVITSLRSVDFAATTIDFSEIQTHASLCANIIF